MRAGIAEIAPALIGLNPIEIGRINSVMDKKLSGHPYVKSAIDMACWDVYGKVGKSYILCFECFHRCCGLQVVNLPVCALLGGRFDDSVELYRAISQLPPKQMAENLQKYKDQGYKRFQLKLGGLQTEVSFNSKYVTLQNVIIQA